MTAGFLSLFGFSYPRIIIYMLQNTEYQVKPYLAWYWRTSNFKNVAKRRTLDMTRRARLLLYMLRLGIIIQLLVGIFIAVYGVQNSDIRQATLGALLAISYPVVWAHLITLPLLAARVLVVQPKEKRLVNRSHAIFATHKATTIAVAGSYGKTTVKELLLTVLSEGKKVAATPANMNVSVSHARFAAKLTGDEEVLIVEYGEGQPGDVARFAKTTKPDIGIITGLAPAHLDKYKTIKAAAHDIFSLADYLQDKNVYVNQESQPLQQYIKPAYHTYNSHAVLGWKIKDIVVTVNGLEFVMKKGERSLRLSSQLVGRHLVGPLALCVALAHDLGLSDKQIIAGVAKTAPFEHRMQPRLLAGGWVIDDTYNGNLEGVRAGLTLLTELEAKRKIYVTPGLVDQGKEVKNVHIELGRLIAEANPTQVILMNNSVTKWIQQGLVEKKYRGEVIVQDNPLAFYTNLDQIIAVGDIVLMQNDWPDNYN